MRTKLVLVEFSISDRINSRNSKVIDGAIALRSESYNQKIDRIALQSYVRTLITYILGVAEYVMIKRCFTYSFANVNFLKAKS